MASYAIYDPTDWLVDSTRQLCLYTHDYLVENTDLTDDDFEVQNSFPDVYDWKAQTPLSKVIVHFELDDPSNPKMGFGIPGSWNSDGDDPDNLTTSTFIEVAEHMLNFDVGIWVSQEMGGHSTRMKVKQALINMLGTAGGRIKFKRGTGLQVVSLNGGQDVLDRVNDLPLWRSVSMTLIIRVFSEHVHEPVTIATSVTIDPHLKIEGSDGELEDVN